MANYIFQQLMLLPMVLNLFEGQTNVTTDPGLSEEMKTYYSNYLIDFATPELVHHQFGQKHPIPKNGGKEIEFRKYSPLPKALVPITEGVTPVGKKITMSTISCEIEQYGDYVELSDMLLLTAIDNNLVEAVEILGDQAGRTLDTVVRDIVTAGTNVLYGNGVKTHRYELEGGLTGLNPKNDYLTVDAVRRAVRILKIMHAPKINGSYVGIIHPDCTYDLKNDPKWEAVKDYDPRDWYEGEIGRIEGVRFVETTEAKIFNGADLASDSRTLKVNGSPSTTATIPFDGGTVAAHALKGREVLVDGKWAIVNDNTASQLTLDHTITAANDSDIFPGEGGKDGRAVYATMFLGNNAYGTSEITGGGLETIVKQLGSAGTSDPLNQRATAGWKATHAAIRLVEGYMVRCETCSTFDEAAN